MSKNNENIEKLEEALGRLETHQNTIYFLTYDTKNNPRASVKYIYDLAYTLKQNGSNVKILVEDKTYGGVSHWLGEKYNEIDVVTIKEDKIEIKIDDVLVVPEYYSNVLQQVGSIKCTKVMLVQQKDYIFETLPVGSRWRDYGFDRVITTTEASKKYISEIFPESLVHIIPPVIEDNFSISGAISLNLGQHTATIDQGATSRIIAASSKPVAIASAIEASFKNINKAETEQASKAVVNVALGISDLSNTARNTLNGLIQTSGSVSIEAETEYPSLFKEAFGDSGKITKWFSSPANLMSSISDVTGVFVGESFNSFSRVRIAGKEKNNKPERSELGIGIGINVSKITTTNSNIIDGAITAGELAVVAKTAIDFVRGAGSIHIDLSQIGRAHV